MAEPPKRQLAIFAFGPGEVDPIGNEPILANGEVVGRLSSAGFGYHVDHAIGLGYVRREIAGAAGPVEIEILGERRAARILANAPYDPAGKRLRT
ncbi:MAG TPA: glycine cleavage T C-terminal barrel domain-containing protein [Dongiaceae bacterium]